MSLCAVYSVWTAKHVGASIQQIIPLKVGNLHSLLLKCDSNALLCSRQKPHCRAGCGPASLLVSRVRCREVFLVLEELLRV